MWNDLALGDHVSHKAQTTSISSHLLGIFSRDVLPGEEQCHLKRIFNKQMVNRGIPCIAF